MALRMKQLLPRVQIIIILRDPLQRTISQYNMINDRTGTPGQLHKRGTISIFHFLYFHYLYFCIFYIFLFLYFSFLYFCIFYIFFYCEELTSVSFFLCVFFCFRFFEWTFFLRCGFGRSKLAVPNTYEKCTSR